MSDKAVEEAANAARSPVDAPVGGSPNAPQMAPLPEKARTRGLSPFISAFLPNQAVSRNTLWIIAAVQIAAALAIWIASPFRVLPQPHEVARALHYLWFNEGLGPAVWTSFLLSLEALAWTTVISLVLCYLTVIPFFRPLVAAISKGRFLSLVGFSFVFTLILGSGHGLKTSLLVVGVTFFFVTSMAAVIAEIPRGAFDHARTLRMSEWEVVWEVVILGTADRAFEVLRQNAAIGWMMLTMVEGLVRSEGGIGVLLLDQRKHFYMDRVFAIQFLILLVGLIQDYGIGVLRRLVCPYADLTLERK